MKNFTEQFDKLEPEQNENQERHSQIVLHFIRHGEKESGVEGDDTKPRLTSAGRAQAVKISSPNTVTAQSMAFGSERVRSRETAALAMAGSLDGITGQETFYELEAKLKKQAGIMYGKKVFTDPRLNFYSDTETLLGKALDKAYHARTYLKFIVEDSDRMAKELHDTANSTYSTQAAAIAEIVLKYVQVSSQWQKLVNDREKKYEEKMERFLGTHQGIPESFLAKVIDKTKGISGRDQFVASLGGQGFGFAEGFDVEIIRKNNDEAPQIRIRYVKNGKDGEEIFAFDEHISLELLEEIIEEGRR